MAVEYSCSLTRTHAGLNFCLNMEFFLGSLYVLHLLSLHHHEQRQEASHIVAKLSHHFLLSISGCDSSDTFTLSVTDQVLKLCSLQTCKRVQACASK